jgi:hypothetical protein
MARKQQKEKANSMLLFAQNLINSFRLMILALQMIQAKRAQQGL